MSNDSKQAGVTRSSQSHTGSFPEQQTTIIVTVTPVEVESDSRAFKQAASVARFGYHSIVVEGQPSDLDKAVLPFELRSSAGSYSRKSFAFVRAKDTQGENASWKEKIKRLVTWFKTFPLIAPILFIRFLGLYIYHYIFQPGLTIPKASLYYLHAFYQFPAVYLMCQKYHVPYIYDAHDYYMGINDPQTQSTLDRRFIAPFYRTLEALCIKHAAAVVTVNNSIAGLLENEFNRRDILVIQNLQDRRLEHNPDQGLREQLGLTSDIFLLVCVGQYKKGQAFQEALQAMKLLPEHVHLAFVGKNHDIRADMVREFNLEHRVHLIPAVKVFNVVPFIRSSDASIILYYPMTPNFAYCLPNGFFQSIEAELPLLYPELPEIKKIAKFYNLGLPIDPLSPESIRDGVSHLMQRSSLLKYKDNLQRAKDELSWEREEATLYKLLSQHLDEPSRE